MTMLYNRLFLCLFFLSPLCRPAYTSHIVGFPNLDYVSHHRVLWKLGKELQARGHKYTQILPSCAKEMYKDVDIRIFNTSVTNEEIEDIVINLMKVGRIDSLSVAIKMYQFFQESSLLMVMDRFCEDFLKDKSLIAELKASVDLVLCDTSNTCCFILVDILNVARVEVSTVGFAGVLGAHVFRYPQAAVFLTLESSPATFDAFSFKNRLVSFVSYVLFSFVVKTLITENLWKMHAKANSRYTNVVDAWRCRGIVLIPHDFALEYPRPLGANLKVIGAMLPEPADKLPDYLHSFMTRNDKVVVVSFGTTLSKYRPALIEVIGEGLSKLPFAVLWKHSGFMPSTIGKNTKIVEWFPQNDILGHPSTKLFVTHGGLNSFLEGVYHSVPMVVIPLFGDQHRQAILAENKGLGIALDKNIINEEDVTKAILAVLNNKLYAESAKKISAIMKDRKRTPQEEGADWIEYALRHDGALHLINGALDLPDYQLYMFDVFLFLVVLVFVILFLFLRICCCICCSRKADPTKEKKA